MGIAGSDVLARVLERRGKAGPTAADGESGHDPFLLTDMDQAVDVLEDALRGQRRIAVYGDYDADGVTATALLVRCLRLAGADPMAYIPNREGEGYGLNLDALRDLANHGAEVVVSVDCGTTAVEVAAARPPGLRLVITDHHLPRSHGDPLLPPADAVVNPQRPRDAYPFKGLAGVGVAYKLAEALESRGALPPGAADRQLPLVALGTVADLMPLVAENRQLVRRGLALWPECAPVGLLALARAAGVDHTPDSSDLGFGLGPRINAAGRMEDAQLALTCCLTDDPQEARQAAQRLERLNRTRRFALSAAMEIARPMVEELPEAAPAIILGHETFHPGIVGLVAGRLSDEFQRPAFVYSRAGAEWRGSARGVDGLNVVQVLAAAAPELLRFGGHQGAGGFSLAVSDGHEARFANLVAAAVSEQAGGAPPLKTYPVDAILELSDCHLRLADDISGLGPFGRGNPSVLFCALGCEVLRTEPFGRAGEHLRVFLADRSGSAEAITFNRPWLRPHLPSGRRVDVLFELDVDRWRGAERSRLLVRDLRPERGEAVPDPIRPAIMSGA